MAEPPGGDSTIANLIGTRGGGSGSPPHIHPHKSSGSKDEGETDDTATSKRRGVENIMEVEMDDLDVLKEMFEYHYRHEAYPIASLDHMRRFCFPWVQMGIGNPRGWVKKVRGIRDKFDKWSNPTDPVKIQEFQMWKKIFGKRKGLDVDEDGIDIDRYDNIDVLRAMLLYKSRNGAFPTENADHMRKFCLPWIQMGIGNPRGWIKKVTDIRNKFTTRAPMLPAERSEYKLWKRVVLNNGDDDGDEAGPSGVSWYPVG